MSQLSAVSAACWWRSFFKSHCARL